MRLFFSLYIFSPFFRGGGTRGFLLTWYQSDASQKYVVPSFSSTHLLLPASIPFFLSFLIFSASTQPLGPCSTS